MFLLPLFITFQDSAVLSSQNFGMKGAVSSERSEWISYIDKYGSYPPHYARTHAHTHTCLQIAGMFFLRYSSLVWISFKGSFSEECKHRFGIAQWYSIGLRAGWSGVQFPVVAGNFSLHHRVQIGSGAHPASYPSSAEVKNVWSHTSTPPYVFMAWCSVKTQGQLYVYLTLQLQQRSSQLNRWHVYKKDECLCKCFNLRFVSKRICTGVNNMKC
jgi:hypothetical protein